MTRVKIEGSALDAWGTAHTCPHMAAAAAAMYKGSRAAGYEHFLLHKEWYSFQNFVWSLSNYRASLLGRIGSQQVWNALHMGSENKRPTLCTHIIRYVACISLKRSNLGSIFIFLPLLPSYLAQDACELMTSLSNTIHLLASYSFVRHGHSYKKLLQLMKSLSKCNCGLSRLFFRQTTGARLVSAL
jgi:hypothetical protein